MKIPPVSRSALQRVVWVGIALLLLQMLVRGALPWLGYVLDGLSAVCILGGALALVINTQRSR
jgi:hypothetical protein